MINYLDTERNIASHRFRRRIRERHEHYWIMLDMTTRWEPMWTGVLTYQCSICGMICDRLWLYGALILEEHYFRHPGGKR